MKTEKKVEEGEEEREVKRPMRKVFFKRFQIYIIKRKGVSSVKADEYMKKRKVEEVVDEFCNRYVLNL